MSNKLVKVGGQLYQEIKKPVAYTRRWQLPIQLSTPDACRMFYEALADGIVKCKDPVMDFAYDPVTGIACTIHPCQRNTNTPLA